MFANRIIFCNDSPMKTYLEKEIKLNNEPMYDNDEINEIYQKIVDNDSVILKAK